MTLKLTDLATRLTKQFGKKVICLQEYGELTIEVAAADLIAVCTFLKAAPYDFAQLMDLIGIDYLHYSQATIKPRFAVAYHLLSHTNNLRARIKSYCDAGSENCPACKEIIKSYACSECGALAPHLPTVVNIWSVANWYEREAFDLFGIIFTGHPALTRILTEDDVQGHALRKDFPMVGKTESYYDEVSAEVKVRTVSIEDRTVIHKTAPTGGCIAKNRLGN